MITIGYSTRKIDENYIKHIKSKSFYNNEIIFIENNGEFSLTQVYNKILDQATYDIVLLIHDDLILPANFDKKLHENFENSNYGILGVAGTCNLNESGIWWENRSSLVGKVWHQTEEKTYATNFSKENSYINEVVVIDGLFIGIHKKRISHKFNELIPGFHFYDVSFCVDNFNSNVKIGVFFYGKLIHKSVGKLSDAWKDNRSLFLQLYGKQQYNLSPSLNYKNLTYDKVIANKSVAIIIPSKNNFDILSNCINSILTKVEHFKYHIFIADTGSDIEDLLAFKTKYINDQRVTVLNYDYYHFGKINNDVVNNYTSDYDYLLFCNDDIEFINDSLSEMLKVHILKKNVGTVGARLYYPNHLIQHSGVITYLDKKNNTINFNHEGIKTYFNADYDNTEVIGNTAALLMIKRNIFIKINGFIENNRECFEDVILNLKCLDMGLNNIFAGNAVAYHMESVSRKKSDKKVENERYDYINFLMPHYQKNYKNYKKYLKII